MPFRKARNWGGIKPPAGTPLDWGDPINSSITTCALFNEGAGKNVLNVADNKFTGSSNPTSWGTAAGGNGIKNSEGSIAYMDVSGSAGTIKASTFSIGFTWIGASHTIDQRVIERSDVDNSGYAFQITTTPATTIYVHTSGVAAYISFTAPTKNKYTHIAYTWENHGSDVNADSEMLILYVNGVRTSYTVLANGSGDYIDDPNRIAGIAAAARSFDGVVHHFRKWKRRLSPSEVSRLYVEPFAGLSVPRRRIISGTASVAAVFMPASGGTALPNEQVTM